MLTDLITFGLTGRELFRIKQRKALRHEADLPVFATAANYFELLLFWRRLSQSEKGRIFERPLLVVEWADAARDSFKVLPCQKTFRSQQLLKGLC